MSRPWLATRRFPYLAHIGYKHVNEVAKGLETGDGRLVRRQPLIDAGLSAWRARAWASSRRRNVSRSKAERKELMEVSNQTGIPTLVCEDGSLICDDDEKIIAYLEKHCPA